MSRFFVKLWRDTCGEMQVSGALLLCVIVSFGAITGLTALRNQLVQEFGDVGLALEKLNQSYSNSLGTFVDTPSPLTDPAGAEPGDLDVDVAAMGETP